VQWKFDPDDEGGFYQARPEILASFRVWLLQQGSALESTIDGITGDVGIVLDWKWGYADGDLGSWSVLDIAEFLLEWCPRKLSVPPERCDVILVALREWLGYLDAAKLSTSDTEPVAILMNAIAAMRDDFIAAMGDRSKFGQAKSLVSLAVDDGVDMSDPQQFQEFVERFNQLSISERRDLLPDSVFDAGPRQFDRTLPPVAMPSDHQVAKSAAEAPILSKFRDLATFVGAGRKLTKKGHLTLADARVLVELLATGDAMDEQIGDRTFRTTSSDDLPNLRMIVAWAKKAGIVRVLHGKLVTTKRGLGLRDDLVGQYDHVVDALLAVGPVSVQSYENGWRSWPQVWAFLDDLSVVLLIAPFVAMGSVPLEGLIDYAATEVLGEWQFAASDDTIRNALGAEVVDMFDAFALCGLLVREDVEPHKPGRRAYGGSITLTPIGTVTTRRLLEEVGYVVPVAGQFVASSAVELFERLDEEEFEMARAEIVAWCKVRDSSVAIDEIAEAITVLTDPALQNVALAVLAEIDVRLAAPRVFELLAQPAVAGFATCWLADHGFITENELYSPATPFVFVDVLALRMLSGGPDGLLSTLEVVGNEQRQSQFVETMWRAPSPARGLVLAAIDKVHPSKIVRKAARRALFKLRSSSNGR
jgi:hypothetical protein